MKAPTLADKLDALARQLDMIPMMDASADTITSTDEFYKGCAVAILAEVKRCEQMLDTITDPDTRTRTRAALAAVRRVLADVAALTPRSRETGFTLDPRASWQASWHREFPRAAEAFRNPEPADFAAVTTAKAPARLTKQAECLRLYEIAISQEGFEDLSPAAVWEALKNAREKLPCKNERAFVRNVDRAISSRDGSRRERKTKARSVVRADQIERKRSD